MTKPTLLALVAAALLGLSACNTVQGVGQDVKQAGEALDSAAQKTKDQLR